MKKPTPSKTPEYLDFLNDHPAINRVSENFFNTANFWVLNCSAEGREKDAPVAVNRSNLEDYKRFERLFEDDVNTVYVPYNKYYGKDWKYDHTRYYCEVFIYIFKGDFTRREAQYENENWLCYSGFYTWGKTFDEMIENAYNEVKTRYGDFGLYSKQLLTSGEKKKYKKTWYSNITTAMLNRRWARWYMKTNDYKSTWGNELDALIKTTPKMVWDFSNVVGLSSKNKKIKGINI